MFKQLSATLSILEIIRRHFDTFGVPETRNLSLTNMLRLHSADFDPFMCYNPIGLSLSRICALSKCALGPGENKENSDDLSTSAWSLSDITMVNPIRN